MSVARDEGAPMWWGRVFGDGTSGGNHTAIVGPGAVPDPAAMARRLAIPDTAVVDAVDDGQVSLRTFSPVEELAQCIQTSLAAVVALELPDGRSHDVRHRRGEPLRVEREGTVVWVHEQSSGLEIAGSGVELPPWLADQLVGTRAERTAQARPRLLVRCSNIDQVEGAVVERSAVRALCVSEAVNGLVLFARDGQTVRVRVFTTSLDGAEDIATGGAVLAVGAALRREGVTGELAVRQGGPAPEAQGHMRLRIDQEVALGGQVLTLARGQLVTA